MRGIKIPQYEFALKMQGGLMREGGRICGTLRYTSTSLILRPLPIAWEWAYASLLLYSGKLFREKTFVNFAVLWLFVKVFSAKFWGVASFGAAKVSNLQKFSPRKLYFSPLHESFLPRKYEWLWLYVMCVWRCYPHFMDKYSHPWVIPMQVMRPIQYHRLKGVLISG